MHSFLQDNHTHERKSNTNTQQNVGLILMIKNAPMQSLGLVTQWLGDYLIKSQVIYHYIACCFHEYLLFPLAELILILNNLKPLPLSFWTK